YRDSLSPEEFCHSFLIPNLPVLLGPSLTSPWPAHHHWVVHQPPHSPQGSQPANPLDLPFGEAQVSVADCCPLPEDGENGCMSNPSTTNDVLSKTDVSVGQFYLKDWHLVKDYPNVAAYATPALFTDDWINEFWDHRTDSDDDYRFVYIGGHRTWTPFHTDVFRSYSWSTNICGIKLWTMYPPGQESTFTDSFGNTVFDINNYNHAQFPHFENATRFQVYQLPGQTLFVPSGWAHQVENIGETISINHNWANACNLPDLYGTLVRELDLVEHAIRDCAGMEGWSAHCQLLLRANHGIHFADFYRLLAFKARSLV
ncbi:hypothetical protein BJ085DRAFT_559, partial [Dimargaris cristalligena]